MERTVAAQDTSRKFDVNRSRFHKSDVTSAPTLLSLNSVTLKRTVRATLLLTAAAAPQGTARPHGVSAPTAAT